MLLMKLKLDKHFVFTTLTHVHTGKSKDKDSFLKFKKMLASILLVQDNFIRNWEDFERIYDLYKECGYENLELYEKHGNGNE